eukprot:1616982-Rhodomonas_salina.1
MSARPVPDFTQVRNVPARPHATEHGPCNVHSRLCVACSSVSGAFFVPKSPQICRNVDVLSVHFGAQCSE